MVRHFFPQGPGSSSVPTNTNYPPQRGTENIIPPGGGNMDYEDSVRMEYEDDVDMDYEG